MKFFTVIFCLPLILSCENRNAVNKEKSNQKNNEANFKTVTENKSDSTSDYTAYELEMFLDSVSKLPVRPLIQASNFVADSIFKNQKQLHKTFSKKEFNELKLAISNQCIDYAFAKKLFGEISVDSVYIERGIVPITFISFDKRKNDFNEFAICFGYPDANWTCELYFFKGNLLLARHIIEHHYGLEMEHYKDEDGKTVIYYKENFGTGTGIWQFNYYFYKFDDHKLSPVLNLLENGNLQTPWGLRVFWYEAKLLKTRPLTFKMVYYQSLYDTTGVVYKIIEDSSYVTYHWNEELKAMAGDFANSKISEAQILSYNLSNNELLFINAYSKELKLLFHQPAKRYLLINYLSDVKHQIEKKSESKNIIPPGIN